MTQTAQPTDKPTAVATIEEGSIADQVLHRVTTMEAANELTLPEGYHVGNALKSAWLYLQSIKDKADRPATQTCTRASIANCLLEMVIRGEHPMHHCYFIPTGNQLTFWEKYTGKLMRAKRDTDIQAVNAQVVYKGDEFTYTVDEDGRYQLVAHKTSIQNMTPANIVAAYAVVIMRDGSRHIEVMTLDMIRSAWGQGAAKGNSGAHRNFTDQMAKKTVIARACKIALDSTADGFTSESDDRDDFMATQTATTERDQANTPAPGQQALPPRSASTAPIDPFEQAANEAEEAEAVEIGSDTPAANADAKTRKCPV